MNREQITPLLVFSDDEQCPDDIFASEALSILDYQTDVYDEWKQWKYVKLLNRYNDALSWKADPRWLEQSVKIYFVKKAHRMFRAHPFTDTALLAWYTVKQYELDCIRTAAEGIKINARPEEMKVSAGIMSEL
jgi:vacuolar-type H+-ATPase subunit C/Vma6